MKYWDALELFGRGGIIENYDDITDKIDGLVHSFISQEMDRCDHRDLHSFPTRRSSDLLFANPSILTSSRSLRRTAPPPPIVYNCC